MTAPRSTGSVRVRLGDLRVGDHVRVALPLSGAVTADTRMTAARRSHVAEVTYVHDRGYPLGGVEVHVRVGGRLVGIIDDTDPAVPVDRVTPGG